MSPGDGELARFSLCLRQKVLTLAQVFLHQPVCIVYCCVHEQNGFGVTANTTPQPNRRGCCRPSLFPQRQPSYWPKEISQAACPRVRLYRPCLDRHWNHMFFAWINSERDKRVYVICILPYYVY